VDTLKAGLDAIVEILQDSADEPPTPVHEYDMESIVSDKESVAKAAKTPSGKALPNWIISPVSQVAPRSKFSYEGGKGHSRPD
jgi:hypothetical protein